MLGWSLFKRAAFLLADNLLGALRVSMPPVLVLLAFMIAIALVATNTFDPMGHTGSPYLILVMVIFCPLLAFALLWSAVTWHRIVLLAPGDRDGGMKLHGAEVLGYLGRLLLVSILMMIPAIFILPFATASLTASSFGENTFGAMILRMTLINSAVAIPIVAIFYCLSSILPACALGKPVSLAVAWRATSRHYAAFIVLAILTTAFQLIISIPSLLPALGMVEWDTTALTTSPNLFHQIYNGITTWIMAMLGLSVMSVIYGHFIEGRALD